MVVKLQRKALITMRILLALGAIAELIDDNPSTSVGCLLWLAYSFLFLSEDEP